MIAMRVRRLGSQPILHHRRGARPFDFFEPAKRLLGQCLRQPRDRALIDVGLTDMLVHPAKCFGNRAVRRRLKNPQGEYSLKTCFKLSSVILLARDTKSCAQKSPPW